MSVVMHRRFPASCPEVEREVIGAVFGAPHDRERLLRASRGDSAMPPADFVVAAWVFSTALDRMLWVQHRCYGWCAPGGRFDSGDQNPAAAASRELFEETGLRLAHALDRPLCVLPQGSGGLRPYGLAYLFFGDPVSELRPEEGQPAKWWTAAQAAGVDGVFGVDIELFTQLMTVLSGYRSAVQ